LLGSDGGVLVGVGIGVGKLSTDADALTDDDHDGEVVVCDSGDCTRIPARTSTDAAAGGGAQHSAATTAVTAAAGTADNAEGRNEDLSQGSYPAAARLYATVSTLAGRWAQNGCDAARLTAAGHPWLGSPPGNGGSRQ
jgi:hypothetical protein